MATQKPISTISYNSEAFLKEKLDSWYKAHVIQAYQYILHKGEDGDKNHIHVRIEPNKKLDPMELKEQLREYVIGQEKPLCVRPFRPSKEEDWFLYAVHDPEYLALKYSGGESREKLPYQWQDIRVPDDYDVETAFIRAKASMAHSTSSIAARLQSGENPLSMVFQGENVYTVNALTRMLVENDYQRVQKELEYVSRRFGRLLTALSDNGIVAAEDEDGEFSIIAPKM